MAMSRIQDEVLQCTICYDTYETPKTLPCLHTFCEHCLADYIKGVQGAVKKNGFSCPVCRDFIKAPDPKRRPQEWAALFKTNFHLNKLMKALEEKPGSTSPGEGPFCAEHSQKELDLFCVQCVKPICHLCAGIAHRGCSLVVTLEEAADDKRVHLNAIRRQMNDTLVQSRDEVAKVKKQLDRIRGLKDECTSDIKKYTESLVAVIRNREAEMLQDLEEKHETLNETVDLKIDTFRDQQKASHQALVQLTELVSEGTAADILGKHSSFENVGSVHVPSISSLCGQLQRVELRFMGGTYLKKLNHNASQIGEVVLEQRKKETVAKKPTITPRPSPDNQQVTLNAKRNQSGTAHFRRSRSHTIADPVQSQPTNKPVKLKTISGKHREDDQPPKLNDIVVLTQAGGSHGKIVIVTDWNNQCVKAFYSRRDRDSRLLLGGKPWSVTALSHTTIAVTIPLAQQICVLKVGSSMMLLSSVVAEKKYSALAALDRNTLVASGGSTPPSVDIINVSGEVLHSFSRDAAGAPLFTYPAYLCSTPKGHILVSDRDAGTLTCLTREGVIVWCFHPQGALKLENPGGVYCDPQGRVVFAESRGVLSLLDGGQYKGAVLRTIDGVDTPRGVWAGGDGTIYLTHKQDEICVFSVGRVTTNTS
ncbi:tripartite motif-containing protein 3-like [Haliotis rufescens]|uniref:tripartite motif-containing protein 3-like n=1 Tax=Haliotis rufescens TaxID=6454 RepID=UPI00201EB8F9|nr:tripartite motif-containing protein 3-like [Haliotis rufescens]